MAPDTRFAEQRYEFVMNELRREGSIGVGDIATRLSVSQMTVRRDIEVLARRGLLSRVHGGAVLVSTANEDDWPPTNNQSKYKLGIVVPSLEYFWPGIIRGVRATATAKKTAVVVRGSAYDGPDNRRQIEKLIEPGKVHGLLLAPTTSGPGGPDLLRWIGGLSEPHVLMERFTPSHLVGGGADIVATDHRHGTEIAVRHLRSQGHTKIGILISRESPTAGHILRGWAAACAELGIPNGTDLVHETVSFDAPHREHVLKLVSDKILGAGITALIIHSDPHAVDFAQFCSRHGIAIPDDVAVVAYGDEGSHLGEPPLTAVRPAKQHVGRLAVEMLLARLEEGPGRPTQRIYVNPTLVVRESSVTK
ncbi:DeoR/GlpR family transcriptional regulator [Paenarthrobacter sp. MSM-2-10-13]|uniref:LacI family DNA-binding transcriptional regulator n=1 Tax=Paenarthrobacter sp. MSM-2-10-13 TaxID=2717318 RepID=UPI00141F2FCF|nr:substrate-binding domain-containing protein [Paenarthrobacter sp. MSM-2-10-13]NHW47402.1 DeoR/GlpR family transcriptional regulator [Paenarthrobacter sp. MSM-2-10-13]